MFLKFIVWNDKYSTDIFIYRFYILYIVYIVIVYNIVQYIKLTQIKIKKTERVFAESLAVSYDIHDIE